MLVVAKKINLHPSYLKIVLEAVTFSEITDVKSLKCANRVMDIIETNFAKLSPDWDKIIFVDPRTVSSVEFGEAQADGSAPATAVYDENSIVTFDLSNDDFKYLMSAWANFLPKINPAVVGKRSLLAIQTSLEKSEPVTTVKEH